MSEPVVIVGPSAAEPVAEAVFPVSGLVISMLPSGGAPPKPSSKTSEGFPFAESTGSSLVGRVVPEHARWNQRGFGQSANNVDQARFPFSSNNGVASGSLEPEEN